MIVDFKLSLTYVYGMDPMRATKYEAEILATLGPLGRMISASKTDYREANPAHLPVFNANVCLNGAKVWWGDIDLTTDEMRLLELARRIGEVVYLLHESDGRFRNEDAPRLDQAVYSAAPTGHTRFDPVEVERRPDGRLYARPRPRPRRWRRPARPRLWPFWRVTAECVRSRGGKGTQTSRFLRVGRHGASPGTPLLVLGVHMWSREARGGWVECIWYPTGHRAWAPPLSGRAKWHRGNVRPYVSLRVAPGLAHEIRAGIIIGPIDFLWG